MAHLRTQIRAALVSRLTGLTTTASRVKESGAVRLEADASPTLAIIFGPDVPDYAEGSSMGSPAIARVIEAHIHTYASDLDTADLSNEEVETAIYTDQTFGGLAEAVQLGDVGPVLDADGQRVEYALDLVYFIKYRAAEGAPGSVA